MTSDIAYAFGTPPSEPKRLKFATVVRWVPSLEKMKRGSAERRWSSAAESATSDPAEVIEPRYTELLNLVNEEIFSCRKSFANKGLNITWRQALFNRWRSADRRSCSLCSARVSTQVRIGAPLNITGLTDYAQDRIIRRRWDCFTMGKSHILTGS